MLEEIRSKKPKLRELVEVLTPKRLGEALAFLEHLRREQRAESFVRLGGPRQGLGFDVAEEDIARARQEPRRLTGLGGRWADP